MFDYLHVWTHPSVVSVRFPNCFLFSATIEVVTGGTKWPANDAFIASSPKDQIDFFVHESLVDSSRHFTISQVSLQAFEQRHV